VGRGKLTGRIIKLGGVAAVAALAAACSSGAGTAKTDAGASPGPITPTPTPTTIAQALGEIPDTGWDTGFISFSATARMTALNGPETPAPYSGLFTLTNELTNDPDPQNEAQQLSLLGFDPLKTPFSVTLVGAAQAQDAQAATVLFGSFSAGTIAAKLNTAGFKREGTGTAASTWTFLSRQATLEAFATCLGSATAGIIGRLYQQPSTPGPIQAAMGITATSSKNASIEVCVAGTNTSNVQAMETRWSTQLRTGTYDRKPIAWSDLLTDPQATVTSPQLNIVRLSADLTPDNLPGQFLSMYLDGSIAKIIAVG
jgi:hypothetical protein